MTFSAINSVRKRASHVGHVCIFFHVFPLHLSSFFFFFFFSSTRFISVESSVHVLLFQKFFFFSAGIKILFMYCSYTIYESHNTIHQFKNYFVTVFSIFNFNNNKFNPNRPLVVIFYYSSMYSAHM